MTQRPVLAWLFSLSFLSVAVAGCGDDDAGSVDSGTEIDGGNTEIDAGNTSIDGGACTTPTQCGLVWEQKASDRFVSILNQPTELAAFLTAVPKGGDLHNHLSGAVYAETYLGWGMMSGYCINNTSFAAVASGQCGNAGISAIPTSGTFFDQIVRAWSMKDFVASAAESGHDHFFATFGKYGLIAGNRRDDSIADIAARAASENQLYIETMFNLGTNVGGLSASIWSGTLTAADLPTLYSQLMANAAFTTELGQDVTAVTNAATRWRTALNCAGATPPPACGVTVRFVAQISRTGGNDQIFGQLVSAFEMASRTNFLVGANLSSPEDDTASLRNYDLHMAMLDFLHQRYKVMATTPSPLHITLHAGELTPAYVPAGFPNATTYHVRAAVEIAHAERIGHGLDVLMETDSTGLLTTMKNRNVLVEICLSSNDQILEVRGNAHPLAAYMAAGVPVALATDDQGVSRSSIAGEMLRAAKDQGLSYRQLKTMARNSLEHAFLPGPSLWSSFASVTPVADCAPTATSAVGETPSAACQTFLAASERAAMQWELERRFRAFEMMQ